MVPYLCTACTTISGSLTGLVAMRLRIRREKRMVIRESEEQLVISYSLLGNVSERELGKKKIDESKKSVQKNWKESSGIYRTGDSLNYNVEPFKSKCRILSKIKDFEKVVMWLI